MVHLHCVNFLKTQSTQAFGHAFSILRHINSLIKQCLFSKLFESLMINGYVRHHGNMCSGKCKGFGVRWNCFQNMTLSLPSCANLGFQLNLSECQFLLNVAIHMRVLRIKGVGVCKTPDTMPSTLDHSINTPFNFLWAEEAEPV